jgi:hypothetical protein
MKKIILLAAAAIAFYSCTNSYQRARLLNGKDLKGWDTYIRSTGLNNDPDNVFSIVELEEGPALKVSGEHFAGISTVEEYSNYHLVLQFKWGEAKYAPKLNDKRDSGLLYHAVGEQGGDGGAWMKSQEFQIQEGDCGDYWGVAGGSFDIPVTMKDSTHFVYDPKGEMLTFVENGPVDRHAIKYPDAENPTGDWNTVELYCLGDSAIHVMNGVVVMRLYNSNLTKGKIQLQSEGAEVYYRKIELEKIDRIPEMLTSK